MSLDRLASMCGGHGFVADLLQNDKHHKIDAASKASDYCCQVLGFLQKNNVKKIKPHQPKKDTSYFGTD